MQTRLRALFSRTERLETRGFTRIHKAVLGLDSADLERELKYSSKSAINQRDTEGRTAISWAAWRGDLDAVQLLIKYGCDVRISSRRKLAPIHYAVESSKESVVRVLLEAGADPNHSNVDLLTPLHWATINSDDPCILNRLISFGACVKAKDSSGATPLMTAVQHNHFNNAEALIKYGANINDEDEDEWTALHFAIFLNHHRCVTLMLNFKINWAHTTEDGSSFLHFFAEYADLGTLRIVSEQQLPAGSFPMQQQQNDGLTISDLISQREVSEEWHNLFDRLTERVWN
jgi:ankyrin repeat protein